VLQRIELKTLFSALKALLGDEFDDYAIDINTTYVTWSYPYTYYWKTNDFILPDGIMTVPATWPPTTTGSTSYNVEIK
jgi:hypothetical protein